MREKINYNWGIGSSCLNIGSLHTTLGQYDTALYYLNRSLMLMEEAGDKENIAASHIHIGEALMLKGDIKRSEMEYLKGLEMADEIGHKKWEFEANKGLDVLMINMKNYRRAFEYLSAGEILKDSLFNEEKSKAIGKLEANHEYEMAEVERERIKNEELRIENKKTERRNLLQYSGILVFLVFLAVGFLLLAKANVPVRFAEGVIFFIFLLFFEFLLVLLDPYIEQWAGGAPAYKLLFNAGIAALIFPLHSFFETLLKRRILKQRT